MTRTLDLENLQLKIGSHEPVSDEMCVMEAVAFVAGEPWTDSPQCASPVIAAFLRSYNDSVSHEVRQTLKQYIPRLIGTRADSATEGRRALVAADWLVRVHTPAWLRLAGLTAPASDLESLPEIKSMAHVPSITPAIEAARRAGAAAGDAAWAARRAADAAWDAAWDVAGDVAGDVAWAARRAAAAARTAAGAAAWDAAGAAAWDAARATAWDAARAAAGAAAWAAAWDAAWAAAGDALKPIVEALQATVPALIEKMLVMQEDK
jgi:hypothetical protein